MAFGLKKKAEPTGELVVKTERRGVFGRLRTGLSKTRQTFGAGLGTVLLGKKTIDEDLLDALQDSLLTADVGVDMSAAILETLRQQVARRDIHNETELLTRLKNILIASLKAVEKPLVISDVHKPFVIMMVGVNGSGKTTTTGKLAKKLQTAQKKVLLAAADTFRAAAVEQLQIWGERNQVPVIAQHTGADSAAVCFDALASAKARQMDVLIADTAGRLHTQSHLMNELSKVARVIKKADETAPHEVLLVLDASIGQNALLQAKQFCAAVPVSGLCITKLDGTAKGGIVFAIAHALAIPIRYIGVGEGIDDLREFDATAFVDALFEV